LRGSNPIMPLTCENCGAVLSVPCAACQHCGHAIHATLEPTLTQPTPPQAEASPVTPPPVEDKAQDDEAAKVDRLLGQIASQSHFEERYELRGVLASGGMGQVHRAYDRILRREVAVKMMRDDSSSWVTPAIRGQFLKEARVGGRLLHPNILAVFDLGVNRAGHIYYTMRLVDGASLQHSLDSVAKGVVTQFISYPLRKIVESLVGACQGVDYAHQNGVIHLDLKPQNILVSGFHEVFVIDWGLARVDEVDDTERLLDLYGDRSTPGNTEANTGAFGGRVVGTPGYMAPEQAQGDYGSFNATTDVFGMGGIIYFVLYGAPPNQGGHGAERLSAISVPKQRGKLRQGILPRGRRVSREAQRAIDSLQAICLKALEVDQQQRYPDIEKMIVDLNEWLSTTPAPPDGF
jgi:serine/threonine-protein kinase